MKAQRMYCSITGSQYEVRTDPQQNRVYRWEDQNVGILDYTPIDLRTAQIIVDYVWSSLGREYPPRVIDARHGNQRSANGSRFEISLPKHMRYTWIVLHELAHSANMNEDGAHRGEPHGEYFMRTYIDFLSRFGPWDREELMKTAREAKLKVA